MRYTIKVDGQEEKTVNMIKESHGSGKRVVLRLVKFFVHLRFNHLYLKHISIEQKKSIGLI
jgi:hypothetical protein